MRGVGLKLPTGFLENESRLPVQYSFKFQQLPDTPPTGINDTFDILLSDNNDCEEYIRDLLRVQAALARYDNEWELLAPIPVLLGYSIQEGALAFWAHHLHSITELIGVNHLLPSSGSVFKAIALTLNVAHATLNSPVMDALCSVITSGARVEFLTLPRHLARSTCTGRVGHFIRTMLGIAPESEASGVVRLSLPSVYAKSYLWAPFCSALAVARTLRVLLLHNPDEDPSTFGNSSNSRLRAWSWLALALFSCASSTSVETLIIWGHRLHRTTVEGVRAVANSPDPVALLSHSLSDDSTLATPTLCPARPRIVINESDIMKAGDGKFERHYARLLDRAYRWEGEVVSSDATTGEDLVLVAGLGFCRVKTAERPQEDEPCKRSRLESSFHTLVYAIRHPCPSHYLTGLLEVIGRRVKALHTFTRPTREKTLEKVFSCCPHLESLSIKSAAFETMDVFTRAYEVYNLSLTSLALSKIDIPEAALQHFLRSLLDEGKAEATLQRLCFGGYWRKELSPETFAILKSLLDHNKSLTHVHYYLTAEQSELSHMDEYHGQVVSGLSIAKRRQNVARLGCLAHFTDRSLQLHLDDHVKQLIWQFGFPKPIQRKVSHGCTTIRERRPREAPVNSDSGPQEPSTDAAHSTPPAVD